MMNFIRDRLELKIIAVLAVVIVSMIATYTYIDIRDMRLDTIRTSERTLGAFAAAIKGSVNASMKKGHHEDIRQILKEVSTPFFIDRVLIYNSTGRPRHGAERMHGDEKLEMGLTPEIMRSVPLGDVSDIRRQGGNHFISYYSPIVNQAECFRCHGRQSALNGILRVDFSLRELDDLILLRRNRAIIWSIALVVLLIAILAAILRLMVYRPVRELRDAMASVLEGATPFAMTVKGSDELADLKTNFVAMINRVSSLHQTAIEREKEIARNQEVHKFRAELQAMFDAMPDGLLLIDNGRNIMQTNPRARALLPGIADSARSIRADELRDEMSPYLSIEQAFQNAQVSEHQCSLTLSTGEIRHLHCICAPIMAQGSVTHVVEVVRDISERVRTERELEEKSAELMAANKTLSLMAITDSLTRVYNRHRFDEILAKEIKRYSRNQYRFLSIMMIDIDHFKKLNDTYGHLAGDAVLREIAQLLKGCLRDTDSVARYGGEEFVIVMPGTDRDGAVHKAEILRKRAQEAVFTGSIQLTLSIGVAEYSSGSPEDIVRDADQALYHAKQSGRNAVVAHRQAEVAV